MHNIALNVFKGQDALRDFLHPHNTPYIPLVELPPELNPYYKERVRIFVKLMHMVPLGNVKSLPAHNMLSEADRIGKLKGVHSLVENSSGNTVFSLAVLGRLFGIPTTKAIVSHEVSPGKLQLLRLFGTEIMVNREPICPDPRDKESGIYKAKKMGTQKGWFNPGQYDNNANPHAHEKWTGPQLWEQTKGELSVFCAGLGTTGTLVGAGRYLTSKNPDITVVGVARVPNNPVPGVRTPHLLEEIAFDWKQVADHVEEIATPEAFAYSLTLCRAGLMAGPSSGFALAGLLAFLRKKQAEGGLDSLRNRKGEIVAAVICPDSPLPYLNEYFEYLDESHFPQIEHADLLLHKKETTTVSLSPLRKSDDHAELSPVEAYETFYSVSPKEAWRRLEEGKEVPKRNKVVIIDIRNKSDFEHFHLPESLQQYPYSLTRNLSRLRKKKVLVVCPMGIRSLPIVESLREKNIEAYSLKGGTTAWSAQNFPRWRPNVCKH